MTTHLTEVLFVSLRMLTLGRFRLCVRRPLIVFYFTNSILLYLLEGDDFFRKDRCIFENIGTEFSFGVCVCVCVCVCV